MHCMCIHMCNACVLCVCVHVCTYMSVLHVCDAWLKHYLALSSSTAPLCTTMAERSIHREDFMQCTHIAAVEVINQPIVL